MCKGSSQKLKLQAVGRWWIYMTTLIMPMVFEKALQAPDLAIHS